ncbi:MAG: hypothetical protein AAFQ85_06010 [Pseudomonadota bacterium]
MGQTLEARDPQLNGELTDLKADIAALRSDFSKLIEDASVLAKAKSEELTDRGQAVVKDAGEQIQSQKAKVEDQVRENPMAAVGIAFGVGVLLAAVSRR